MDYSLDDRDYSEDEEFVEPRDPHLEKYRLQVTDLRAVRGREDSTKTTHDSGGEMVTEHIGIWLRKRLLGRGASGLVFLERNVATERLRAVKKFRSGTREMQDREINNMIFAKDYPRLFVEFHCWYEHGDSRYIAMEYFQGGDLKGYIENFGAFKESEARNIAEQILQGIFILHENNFLHRDIKPENILIASTSPVTIKLADFGLVKQYNGSEHSTPGGTADWAAPEQRSGIYDKIVDMWSVGCVVYYLLTSLKPFGSLGEADIIQKYSFPFWPRLNLDEFQENGDNPMAGDKPIPGDQILIRGVSIAANDFLKHLVVRNRSLRMSAHDALLHHWICPTSPLNSALQHGDLPLSRLLWKHDPRYESDWGEQLSPARSQIVMRVAAANGHFDLVNEAIKTLPVLYNFTYLLPKWSTKPALVGAATNGNRQIVQLIFNKLQQTERSDKVVLEACKAALQGGHSWVVDFLWPHVSQRDCAWDRQFAVDIARYGTPAFLRKVIQHLKRRSEPNEWGVLYSIDPGSYGSAYGYHFQSMVECAAQHGNINNLRMLLVAPPSRTLQIPEVVLRRAIQSGHCDVVILLLEYHHSEIRDCPLLRSSALVTASFFGHRDIVEYLLDEGVIPDHQAMEAAIQSNNNHIFQRLINFLIREFKHDEFRAAVYITPRTIPHCNVALLQWISSTRTDNSIPGNFLSHVTTASHFGDLEVVKWFLNKAKKTSNETPSMEAALDGASRGGHVKIVAFLCANGVDVENVNVWVGAVKGGHIGVLEILLSKCPNPPKRILRPALSAAVHFHSPGIVLQLLCAGARADDGHGRILHAPCPRLIREMLRDFGFGMKQ